MRLSNDAYAPVLCKQVLRISNQAIQNLSLLCWQISLSLSTNMYEYYIPTFVQPISIISNDMYKQKQVNEIAIFDRYL